MLKNSGTDAVDAKATAGNVYAAKSADGPAKKQSKAARIRSLVEDEGWTPAEARELVKGGF